MGGQILLGVDIMLGVVLLVWYSWRNFKIGVACLVFLP